MTTWSLQMCLTLMAFGVFLVWYVRFLWNKRNLYIYSWKVQGPFAFPIIGAAYLFLGNPSDIMCKLIKLQKDYPGLFKLWLGPRLIYSIQDAEHIEKVLTNPKCLDKDYLYKFISHVIGTGLMTAPVAKWRRHRKVIMPAFNQKILDSFVDVFAEQSEVFSEQLMNHVGQKNIDFFQLISRCTLDIICETAMGVKMNSQTTNSDFGKNLDKIMEITVLRIFRIWHHLDFMWRLYPMSGELDKCAKQFRDVTSSVIKRKVMEMEQKKATENSSLIAEIEEGTGKKRLAFLDLILENSNFTEEELREEVEIFLIAGTDTTASSMCCLFAILGLFQDVQQKVYEEAADILGDRTVVASDLPNLKYTERVIKESLRLFPVAAFFVRTIGEDVDLGEVTLPAGSSAYFSSVPIHRNPKYWPDPLKFDPDRFLPEEIAKRHPGTYIPFSMGTRNCIGDYTIPAGTSAVFGLLRAHTNEEYWPDPYKFDPDRFLPEQVVKRHPCAYVPFSYGSRNCAGAKYAMMAMKSVLATVVRKYKISTSYKNVTDIKLKTNLVLRPKDGYNISVELR